MALEARAQVIQEEPQPGRHPDNPEPSEPDEPNLSTLGAEIDKGVTELTNGVGQTALWIASRFAPLFGVNPEN